MSVTIRQMTEEEYAFFCQWSIEHQAKELMEELHISQEQAITEAKAEVAGMLSGGLHTQDNYLMTIVAENETAGFIWTIHEETEGRKQSFLCDFAVWEPKRRKGYGAVALGLAEKHAALASCRESVLFVADSNAAARALYEKCGYRILRQQGYGKYMVKQFSEP